MLDIIYISKSKIKILAIVVKDVGWATDQVLYKYISAAYVYTIFNVSDESPKLKHDGPGLLSTAIADRDSRGSLFTVTFGANHHMDRFFLFNYFMLYLFYNFIICAAYEVKINVYVNYLIVQSLYRKYIVFGKLVQGLEVLKKIENAGDEDRPAVTVKIVNSGEIHDSENHSSGIP